MLALASVGICVTISRDACADNRDRIVHNLFNVTQRCEMYDNHTEEAGTTSRDRRSSGKGLFPVEAINDAYRKKIRIDQINARQRITMSGIGLTKFPEPTEEPFPKWYIPEYYDNAGTAIGGGDLSRLVQTEKCGRLIFKKVSVYRSISVCTLQHCLAIYYLS